jgi:GAF domain-containing protein
MQSERPGTFSESNLPAFEVLAGQLAIAIQNAALFDEANLARADLEEQVSQQSSSGWHEYLNAVDRSEKLGFVFSQNEVLPLVETQAVPFENPLTAPIQIAGANIGEIQLTDTAGRTWTAAEAEIVQATVANVARHIENLRLLAQAEGYRAEAEQASQRLTREGWGEFLEDHQLAASGYLYDQNQVRPFDAGRQDISKSALLAPLIVREETIGELAVDGNTDSAGNAELVAVVAEQLSNHIENLRLSLSNLRLLKSTEERAQREQNLRQITNALRSSTNPETILRTAVRELGGMLGRKTVVQMTPLLENVQGESVSKNGNGSGSTEGSPDGTVGGKE